MATQSNSFPILPPDLADTLFRGIRCATSLLAPFYVYFFDPVPQALQTEFELSYDALNVLNAPTTAAELGEALVRDPTRYCRLGLAAEQMLDYPVLTAAIRAECERHVPGPATWTEWIAGLRPTLDVLLHLTSLLAANQDADLAAATLALERGRLSGLFARHAATLRTAPLDLPPPAPGTAWVLTADERTALQMAARMPPELMRIARPPVAQLLSRLPGLDLLHLGLLQQRLDEVPDDDDPNPAPLTLSPDELLLLWQGTHVSLLALYAPLTPVGTWEEWLLHGPEASAAIQKCSAEAVDADFASLSRCLRDFESRLREHLAHTHPRWAAAEAEIAALREAF